MRNLLAIPDAADCGDQAESDSGVGRSSSKNTLLAINAPMSELRGRWYDFRGTKLAVTYHPAFLLRDPRQKKEAWKDLQMVVMKELGLKPPARTLE